MRAVIIDNESDARSYLKNLLEMFCPEVNVIGMADGVKTGILMVTEKQPDFVFLDVEMDDGTGFDLLKHFANNIFFKVIFSTAYDKYALRAIKLSAIDFLLKPVDPDELIEAVERVREQSNKEDEFLKLQALQTNIATDDGKRIVLKDQTNIYVVNIEDIMYCAGEGSYTTFYLVTEEQITISKNLKVYEKLLPDQQFFRVHTSYIVNLNKIKRITKGLQDIVVMNDNSEIPISVRRKADLIARIS